MVNTQYVNIILNCWKYEGPCPNKSRHCYIVDNVYLRLFAQNIKTQSMASYEQCFLSHALNSAKASSIELQSSE